MAGIRHPRGSALVFAVVLLSILAMMGTAYLIVIQQSSKASTNSMNVAQPPLVVSSGLAQTTRLLRAAIAQYVITAINNGECVVFDPTAIPPITPTPPFFLQYPTTNKQLTSNTLLTSTGYLMPVNPLGEFEQLDNPSQIPGTAWLYSTTPGALCFTSEPMGVLEFPGSGAEIARRISMRDPLLLNTLNDFYPAVASAPPPAIKQLPRTGHWHTTTTVAVGASSTPQIIDGFLTDMTLAIPGHELWIHDPGGVEVNLENIIVGAVGIFTQTHAVGEPITTANGPAKIAVAITATGQQFFTLDNMALVGVNQVATINAGQPNAENVIMHLGAIFDKSHAVASNVDKFAKRDEYYVWVADLDSKLYAAPQAWGVDNTLTANPQAPATVMQNILQSLYTSTTANAVMSGATSDIPIIVSNTAVGGTDPRIPTYATNKDFAQWLQENGGALQTPAYRAALDYYFSTYKDQTDQTNTLQLKFVKDWPTALNINTAPTEVIAAALSQIPCDYTVRSHWAVTAAGATIGQVPCHDGVMLNVHLANRICAKRPFLCRMDFEDFLAAQIMGTIDNEAAIADSSANYNPVDDGLGDNQVIPPDNDAMWWTDAYWTDPTSYTGSGGFKYFPVVPAGTIAHKPPVTYLLYFAIGRRTGAGNTTFAAGSTAAAASADVNLAPNFAPLKVQAATPELTLSQWLEIPGVSPSHPQYTINIAPYGVVGFNTPAAQKLRFRYFVGTSAERAVVVNNEQSLITTKEFNNILNSVTSIYFPPTGVAQDIQRINPSEIGHLPTDIVVSPGTGTACYTTPQGDDTIDPLTGNILCGPNGVAETWTPQYRPSYYSFNNDVALADSIWSTLQATPLPNITGTLMDYANANQSGPAAFYHGSGFKYPDNTISILDPGFMSGTPAVTVATPNPNWPSYNGLTVKTMVNWLPLQTKFFYLFRLVEGHEQSGPNPPQPPTLSPLTMTDLMLWRCRPAATALTDASPALGAAPAFNGRTGFFQMSFDDWAGDGSPPPTSDLGVMQAIGDPQAVPVDTYSTAKSPTILSAGKWVQGDNTAGSGINHNGDVSWSPQFCFRSRFFGIYVLGRGLTQSSAGLTQTGERRIEAVYDALKDEILWQRSPVSEKKSLGDP